MAKQKEAAVVPTVVDSVETLEAKMKAMREAQKVFATFTQEQVDKIFYEAAMAANKQRIPLAKMAVEETQRGIVEDKVIKNHYAAEYIYNAYKSTKTCGVIEEDEAFGIKKVAEPIGLVAAVIPTTNPVSYTHLILAEAGIDPSTRVRDLTQEDVKKISEIIDASQVVEGDLRREIQLNIKRLKEIGCYRGIRHRKGLPVRGQKTKTNARTCKGPKRTVANKKK